jgi:REP element-mobilizing transposase RayT
MVVARKPRENVENGIYHVYARGNAKAPIHLDEADRFDYLRRLGRVVEAKEWRCFAYCLMNNHVHLLVATPKANLSQGMQRLHGGYALAFNQRHGMVGHLFQGRYGAVRIETDEQLIATAAYIARNPAEALLCHDPESWRWSSYRATLDGSGPPWLQGGRILSYFGRGERAGRSYSAFVGAAPNQRLPKGGLTPSVGVTHGV